MTRTALEPGVVAVITESIDAENVGVVVHVEYAYDGPLPEGEERQSGWWAVTARSPICAADVLVPDGVETEAVKFWTEEGTMFLVHADSLLALKVGRNPGDLLRWKPVPPKVPAKRPRKPR